MTNKTRCGECKIVTNLLQEEIMLLPNGGGPFVRDVSLLHLVNVLAAAMPAAAARPHHTPPLMASRVGTLT